MDLRYLKFQKIRNERNRFHWVIMNTEAPYWFRLEYTRSMIPVKQAANPFAGQHHWKIVLGDLRISWKLG
jgi:hypothetical protein